MAADDSIRAVERGKSPINAIVEHVSIASDPGDGPGVSVTVTVTISSTTRRPSRWWRARSTRWPARARWGSGYDHRPHRELDGRPVASWRARRDQHRPRGHRARLRERRGAPRAGAEPSQR